MILGTLYGVYTASRDLATADPSRAFSNALGEVRVEQWFHVFQEARLQAIALHAPTLVQAAGYFYELAHFVVPIAVLIWLYFRHPTGYRRARNALIAVTTAALLVFILLPVVPPRLLPPHFGFVDTVHKQSGGELTSLLMKESGNPYAAMPSVHVAWSVWSAVAVSTFAGWRPLRRAVWALPVVTSLAVVVTANHYFLDILAGALLVGGGWWLSGRLPGQWPSTN